MLDGHKAKPKIHHQLDESVKKKVPNTSGQHWYQPYGVHGKRQYSNNQVWKMAEKQGFIVKTSNSDHQVGINEMVNNEIYESNSVCPLHGE